MPLPWSYPISRAFRNFVEEVTDDKEIAIAAQVVSGALIGFLTADPIGGSTAVVDAFAGQADMMADSLCSVAEPATVQVSDAGLSNSTSGDVRFGSLDSFDHSSDGYVDGYHQDGTHEFLHREGDLIFDSTTGELRAVQTSDGSFAPIDQPEVGPNDDPYNY